MMKMISLVGLALLTFAQGVSASPESSSEAPISKSDRALMEFEDRMAQIRELAKQIENGTLAVPMTIQQRDSDAKEVVYNESVQEYKDAVLDPYYGYQTFILVDKSISKKRSKDRDGSLRQPQTMYVYVREGDQLKLFKVLPVATGLEPAPETSDTREGYMRIQSAQEDYTSKKYGEAMPYSLWFESEYGTAIHETTAARCERIGKRASAGCIRLCPGQAKDLFTFVTQYSRKTPIVLVDKRSGVPIARGTTREISRSKVDASGFYMGAPKVIRGYPTFVRIIDGNSSEKIQELEAVIADPTTGFKNYFKPFSDQMLLGLTM